MNETRTIFSIFFSPLHLLSFRSKTKKKQNYVRLCNINYSGSLSTHRRCLSTFFFTSCFLSLIYYYMKSFVISTTEMLSISNLLIFEIPLNLRFPRIIYYLNDYLFALSYLFLFIYFWCFSIYLLFLFCYGNDFTRRFSSAFVLLPFSYKVFLRFFSFFCRWFVFGLCFSASYFNFFLVLIFFVAISFNFFKFFFLCFYFHFYFFCLLLYYFFLNGCSSFPPPITSTWSSSPLPIGLSLAFLRRAYTSWLSTERPGAHP